LFRISSLRRRIAKVVELEERELTRRPLRWVSGTLLGILILSLGAMIVAPYGLPVIAIAFVALVSWRIVVFSRWARKRRRQ